MRSRLAILALVLVAIWGCARSDVSSRPDGPGDAARDTSAPGPAASFDSTVTAQGFGPVRVGMTLAEAEAALGTRLEPVPPSEPCAFAFLGGRPGIALMVIEGTIARVDIQHGTVKTGEGAGIGDTEERIRALYPGQLEVQPHKYIDGHYLIVRPAAPADSANRIIFETDGARVLRYRAGRLPEVRWIEGCS